MKSVLSRLVELYEDLKRRNLTKEADLVREVLAHYVPEHVENIPEFFRRNYDYGEGFYIGDMSEKTDVKDWVKKHRHKGPEWTKKKKKRKQNK